MAVAAEAEDTEALLRVRAVRGDRPPTHFVYLMNDNNDASEKTTSIEIASNPTEDVIKYIEGKNKHRKGGRSNKCDWRLQLWIGPFNLIESAQLFQAVWKRSGRDLTTRMARGTSMALEMKLAVYTMNAEKLTKLLK